MWIRDMEPSAFTSGKELMGFGHFSLAFIKDVSLFPKPNKDPTVLRILQALRTALLLPACNRTVLLAFLYRALTVYPALAMKSCGHVPSI